MIEAINLGKWYPTLLGRKTVFKDVSFVIPDKVNVGIIGPNGAGKSTLLRILGGIDHPSSGVVRSTGTLSWPMALAGGWQGNMTGRDNTRFVGRLYGLNRNQLDRLVVWVKDFCELGQDFELPIRTYSSGMRSRLTFAVSMAFDFDTYIIDEITAVGDDSFYHKSQNALLAKRGRANFVKVTHNVQELLEEVDMAFLVYKGNIHRFEKVTEAIDAYRSVCHG